MLFIIVHQTFELWFKQIRWELEAVNRRLSSTVLADREIGKIVSGLQRIARIQLLMFEQIGVLETMTPLDFLDFRDRLVPASGSQSVQFRIIENRLGLRDRVTVGRQPYTAALSPEHQAMVARSEQEPSLFDHVERWLDRTPFLHVGEFDFWTAYREALHDLLGRERRTIDASGDLDDHARAELRARSEKIFSAFETLFGPEADQESMTAEKRRLSQKALLAALLISSYPDEPALQLPSRLLTALIDVDIGFATWRYRHALLAHRMIGGKIGTGRSDPSYLEAAIDQHRVFRDLSDLPTYFLPRHALPALPPDVLEQMRFRYGDD